MISSARSQPGRSHATLVASGHLIPAPCHACIPAWLCHYWVRRQARTACRARDRPVEPRACPLRSQT
ncbi:hypothetical protein BDW02DRAFT_573720 [Decorospora gaudefroyi]|uniref:Uncharacterized protein n=1 Tax=Decorospora gaudefroyi TaxID=184978 RepID=A0A6A5JZ40_9PLEO|nr:hypothetical protein BDW02DRAFT_573720 [Decorospora gaudefroyi]